MAEATHSRSGSSAAYSHAVKPYDEQESGNCYKEIVNRPSMQMVCDHHNHVMPAEESA